MLILRRGEDDWTIITDKDGNVAKIKVCRIIRGRHGHVYDLIFDDPARNFKIDRPERRINTATDQSAEVDW